MKRPEIWAYRADLYRAVERAWKRAAGASCDVGMHRAGFPNLRFGHVTFALNRRGSERGRLALRSIAAGSGAAFEPKDQRRWKPRAREQA